LDIVNYFFWLAKTGNKPINLTIWLVVNLDVTC